MDCVWLAAYSQSSAKIRSSIIRMRWKRPFPAANACTKYPAIHRFQCTIFIDVKHVIRLIEMQSVWIALKPVTLAMMLNLYGTIGKYNHQVPLGRLKTKHLAAVNNFDFLNIFACVQVLLWLWSGNANKSMPVTGRADAGYRHFIRFSSSDGIAHFNGELGIISICHDMMRSTKWNRKQQHEQHHLWHMENLKSILLKKKNNKNKMLSSTVRSSFLCVKRN